MKHIDDMPLQFTKKHLGLSITTYFGPAKIERMRDGTYAPKLKVNCSHKDCKNYMKFFVKDGAAGRGVYVCDDHGHIIADLRDQIFRCHNHHSKQPDYAFNIKLEGGRAFASTSYLVTEDKTIGQFVDWLIKNKPTIAFQVNYIKKRIFINVNKDFPI
jgi:hypothetical protein